MEIGYFVGHFPYMDYVNNSDYNKKYAHGGIELVAYHLALEIAKKDYKINVFTTSINSKDLLETSNNMNIFRYGTSFKVASANISFGLFYKPFKHYPDIVHAHSPTPYSDIPALIHSKKNKVPFIITYHADAQGTGGSLIRNLGVSTYNKVLNSVLSNADIIIATSKSYINESEFLVNYKEKTTIIPNGIDIDSFDIPYSKKECRERLGFSNNKYIILFFGNLVAYKGPDILLKAFKLVKKEIKNVELVFAGRGEMQEELELLSKKLNINDSVTFSGFIPEKLKPFYFKAADIFCLPSTTMAEAFGIVNLEAMACNLPIISSRLGGIPDIINEGKTGLLVNPGDYKSLADNITYLLENEELTKKMGDSGRKKVNEYSWKNIADKTDKIYKELKG
ncbi:glycosyltransferase family 4 protein [Methanobacterium sp. ACI-7]|uniref:glycosyltransferase family 4 protein n=1 Tax=unclassified Methanobacterium TaxID=2627676 RepID=UPI0039C40C8F